MCGSGTFRIQPSACPGRLLALLIPLLITQVSFAKDIHVSPSDDVKKVIRNVAAGDTIVLQAGTWTDAKLKFEYLPGTKTAPITIRPKTPGQVVFTGKTELTVSGQYVVVSGLVFRNATGDDILSLRTHSERFAHNSRVTDCVFEQTDDSKKSTKTSRWLSVYGTSNRVDHCYFAGKKNKGTTLVVWVSDIPGHHRIDHNHFGHRPDLKTNGGETIRLGTSDVSESDCNTTVEDNYFHRCNGEAEIVSNKSCGNTYQHNVFDECGGALTLRHGHRCTVNANVFLGRKQGGTGGVRIIGSGHTVTNNYFEGLRGDETRAALAMMNSLPNAPLNTYAPVKNAVVSHNTFIDCKVTFELGIGASKKQNIVPADCRMTHNLLLPDKWPLFRTHAEPKNFEWIANKHQVGRDHKDQLVEFERVEIKLKRGPDGLLRPTSNSNITTDVATSIKDDLDGKPRGNTIIVGCDDPTTPHYAWPSSANTGPSWTKRPKSK